MSIDEKDSTFPLFQNPFQSNKSIFALRLILEMNIFDDFPEARNVEKIFDGHWKSQIHTRKHPR